MLDNPPPRTASYTATGLRTAILARGTEGSQFIQIAGNPICGVDLHRFHYRTVDPAGLFITNSGALMIPTGGSGCSGPRPIVMYAHGTDAEKTLNLSDMTNPANTEGALIAAIFAAQGYIVVAPHYAGYDDSTLSYHPYLNADQQSKDMMDALAAARAALGHVAAATTTDNGKLFITGFSQGGHVAMATHRALQAAGKTVTASAPQSGPYALAAFGDAIMYGNVDLGATVFAPLLTTSYQKSYGNIYSTTTDIYESAYAASIENLLPSTTALSSLFNSGLLPQRALFHNTNWTGTLNNPTLEATLNVPADSLFSLGFGSNNLIKDTYRLSYVLDAMAHPDGLVPSVTTMTTATAPANPLRTAFKLNDLRNWTPTSPVLLCGGDQDPTVFFPINTGGMMAYWTYVAPPASPQLVTELDLETAISFNDPFAIAKAGFSQAKATLSAQSGGGTSGQQAVIQAYHGALVLPFCAVAARGFFSQFL